jgi:toxoflavin synthase
VNALTCLSWVGGMERPINHPFSRVGPMTTSPSTGSNCTDSDSGPSERTDLAGTRDLYDEVATSYDLADQTLVKMSVMGPSVLDALHEALSRDDLRDLVGLDLACGTGFLTRLAARDGARVIGIDLSAETIKSAMGKWHDNIEYRVGDALTLDVDALCAETGGFDFVTAGFLFNYAHHAGQIRELAKRALRVLKRDGVVVGLLPNPDMPIIPANDDNRLIYGLSASMDMPVRNGAPRRVTYWRPDGTELVTIEHRHWSRAVYTREMRRAGADVRWLHCAPSASSLLQDPLRSWRGYEAAPQHDIVVLRPANRA